LVEILKELFIIVTGGKAYFKLPTEYGE